MLETITIVQEQIDGFIPAARELLPRVRSRYGVPLLGYFSLSAAGLKVLKIVLANDPAALQRNLGELTERLLIMFLLTVLFFNYEALYSAVLAWILGQGDAFTGRSENQVFYDIIARLLQLLHTISMAIFTEDADSPALGLGVINFMKQLTVFIPFLLLGLFVLMALIKMLVLFALVIVAIAAVYVLGVICIPFGVFQWSWANSIFFAWLRLCLFTCFACFLLLFSLFLIDRLIVQVSDDYLYDGNALGFSEMLGLVIGIYLIVMTVSYSISLAQSLTGGGGITPADRSSILSLPPMIPRTASVRISGGGAASSTAPPGKESGSKL